MNNDPRYDAPVGTTFREADDTKLCLAFWRWLLTEGPPPDGRTMSEHVAAFLAERREGRRQ